MKLLTQDQVILMLVWFTDVLFDHDDCIPVAASICNLLTAECRAHGFAGIEDAYQRLIEECDK